MTRPILTPMRQGAPLRGAGVCACCKQETQDGRVFLAESSSSAGARVVLCADYYGCRGRRG